MQWRSIWLIEPKAVTEPQSVMLAVSCVVFFTHQCRHPSFYSPGKVSRCLCSLSWSPNVSYVKTPSCLPWEILPESWSVIATENCQPVLLILSHKGQASPSICHWPPLEHAHSLYLVHISEQVFRSDWEDPKAQTAEPMSLGALFPGCHSFEKDLVKVIFAFSKIHRHGVCKSVVFSQLAILKLSPQSNFRALPSPQYNPLNPSAVGSHSHTKPWATLICSVSL